VIQINEVGSLPGYLLHGRQVREQTGYGRTERETITLLRGPEIMGSGDSRQENTQGIKKMVETG
jgi:hypothetical protein